MFNVRSNRVVFVYTMMLLCFTGGVFAAAIPGTAGTAKLQDGPNAEGYFFEVNVHYGAFDGTEATDPLGITPGKIQFAYILEYVAGNEPVGFYDIKSINGVAIDTIGTSTTTVVNGVTPGTEAPLSTEINASGSDPIARFSYSFFGQSSFGGVGTKSVTLAYTASDQNSAGAGYGILTDNSLGASGLVIGPAPINPIKPRSPGYWKHQFSGKGKHKETDEQLGNYMNDMGVYSQVFRDDLAGPFDPNDKATAIAALDPADSSVMLNKAKRQLFALWLNVASGKIDYFMEITFDPADFNTTATTVGGAIEQAESVILNAAATDA
ncbi:MAG: hypothetical protein DRP56_10075, partial [Planctomycetota bacterium]